MTVARFFSGLHPISGEIGIWMSKNGIDVRSTLDPANFLLMPSRKFEQIVKAGEFYIPVYSEGGPLPTVTIPYDTALTKTPYVFFQTSISSGVIYHPHNFDISLPAYTTHSNRTLMINMSISGNNIICSNLSDQYGLYVQYFILHRSITG